MKTILEMGKSAREASRFLMNASTEQKNSFLLELADTLDASRKEILAANQLDYDAADKLTPAMRDRLLLNDSRIDGIKRFSSSLLSFLQAFPDILRGRILRQKFSKASRRKEKCACPAKGSFSQAGSQKRPFYLFTH